VSTRDRIVQAAAAAFQRQGYSGTGLKQITTDSAAPLGSIYHFFPGGKTELAAAALRWAGAEYLKLVEGIWDAAPPDPLAAVAAVFAAAADHLELSDFADACPIATVALEVASTNDSLREVTAEIFESWIQSATGRFRRHGLPPARARELAIAVIAALEGGFLLSRAARDATPLRTLGRTVGHSVSAALDRAS
jgi:AcrR family transcriptional regulator